MRDKGLGFHVLLQNEAQPLHNVIMYTWVNRGFKALGLQNQGNSFTALAVVKTYTFPFHKNSLSEDTNRTRKT